MQLKTEPRPYQLTEYEAHREAEARGLIWEPGVGKTKPTIDSAAWLYAQGHIRGLVVLAPNGVHANWVTDELPKHLPDEVAERTRAMMWWTTRSSTKWHQREAAALLAHDGFSILCMTYDGMMQDRGAKFAKALFERGPCMFVLDEAHRIKTPGAKRTIRVLAAGKHTPFRRILTGTLVDDKPFDTYCPIKFLDPAAWEHLGIGGAESFRSYFGRFILNLTERGRRKREAGQEPTGRGDTFRQVVGYKNLDEMRVVVERYCSRLTKDEVCTDIPPKTYGKRYFELPPAWLKLYDSIREELFAELPSGGICTAPLAITRMLRLQQITSGYLPDDEATDDEPPQPLPGPNPRIGLLMDLLEDWDGYQVVVWARYRTDIDQILEALAKAKISAVRYDGKVDEVQRLANRKAFQDGSARVFVANPATGCEGVTLVNAKLMVMYSNGYRLGQRQQAEDRIHRVGQEDPVTIVDLAARNSVDNHIIKTLRNKHELAAQVHGDELREWI